jgi:hypothetical protein
MRFSGILMLTIITAFAFAKGRRSHPGGVKRARSKSGNTH